MVRVIYQRISPAPTLPESINYDALKRRNWDSKAIDAQKFKRIIKQQLRKLQSGQCCYCRRNLFDNNTVDFEHILEKSVTSLNYEIENLALSCKTCNQNKLGSFTRVNEYLKKRGAKSERCLALDGAYTPETALNTYSYRIVHPHFHRYSDHILVHRDWLYKWLSAEGRRTIALLDLNNINNLELAKLDERLQSRRGLPSLISHLFYESNEFRKRTIVNAIIKKISK